MGVLQTHRDLLERGARALLEKETLSMAELQELVSATSKITTVANNSRGSFLTSSHEGQCPV